MKALRFLGNGESDVAQVPDPIMKSGEVLVKIMSSAFCGSENKNYFSELKEHPYIVKGHEASGVIIDSGDTHFTEGETVVIQIMDGCGECSYCKNGLYQFCKSLQYCSNGSYAQYMVLPEKCVVAAPKDISFDMLALLGGDTVGVAYRATKQLGSIHNKTVFVSGGGPIGLGVTALLRYYGCHVIVSEPSAYRRDYLLQHAGANQVIDPNIDGWIDKIIELTEGIGPEYVFECSGNPAAQIQALELVRCQGTVIFCGENYNELKIIPSNHIIHKEVTLKGAFYFSPADFVEIVQLYRNGLDVSSLASHIVLLAEAPEMMKKFTQGKTGKVIIHPQE